MAYRCSASCKEGDAPEIAILRTDKLVREILEQIDATSYTIYLSGENFRKTINPEYKANRVDQISPLYLQDAKEFLVSEWKAKIGHGVEADDMLGINQTQDTVICSLDKDLRMIPGKHFSWQISGTKKDGSMWTKEAELFSVTEEQGNKTFWKQMLIGDTSDNIFGVDGLGPVKSGKLIDGLETDQECFEVVFDKYKEDIQRFVMNAHCLWILRSKESAWHKDLNLVLPSQLQQEAEAMYESMKSLMVDM